MADRTVGEIDRRPGRILGGVALVTTVLALVIGRAVAPYLVADPGPLVRWGLPLVRTVHDLAAAATIGFAFVGAFLVPETTRTRRRLTASGWAARAALLWAFTAVLGASLTFADLAGTAPGADGFLAQLRATGWSVDTVRNPLLTAIVAVAIAALVGRTESKVRLAWGFALGVLALMPLALVGHTSASVDHMNGVNGLAVHLVAACLWVGGLAAIAVLRPGLGAHLPVVLRRFSAVALWCVGALLLSGLLVVVTSIASPRDLLSRYGLVLAIKVFALTALVAAGWAHRRRVIAGLEAAPQDTVAFVRLLLAEIATMGVAFGAATALTRTPAPGDAALAPPSSAVYQLSGYPDPGPPDASSWWRDWSIDWLWLAVAAVAVGVYVSWVLRLRRRGDSWPWLRTACWVVGWLVFVYATCGAPGVYGRILFSWHMVMHMSVAMVVPLFLVPAAPITLALRALPARRDRTMGPREALLGFVHSRYLAVFANPAVAASMFFFSMAIFYFSPLFELALRTHTGHVLMMVHFLLAGYVFAWVLVGIDPGPKRWSPLALLVVLFATISFHAFFGVILTGMNSVLAPEFFTRLALPWGPDPLRDQRLGGEIAWGVGEGPTLALALMVALQWMRSDARETRRTDRRAERDGDADLEAYNSYLAALREKDSAAGRR